MRLDEVDWRPASQGVWHFHVAAGFHIWHHRASGRYDIWRHEPDDWWTDLDALTAQAVLFDLCSRSDP